MVGVVAIGLWTVATAALMFFALKATIGLRVSKAEEEAGLDIGEHGMVAYPDLAPLPTGSTVSGAPAN